MQISTLPVGVVQCVLDAGQTQILHESRPILAKAIVQPHTGMLTLGVEKTLLEGIPVLTVLQALLSTFMTLGS